MVDLMAYWTGYRLIGVVVLRRVFGGETLNAVSGYGAAIDEKRHGRKALGLDGAEGATPGSSA